MCSEEHRSSCTFGSEDFRAFAHEADMDSKIWTALAQDWLPFRFGLRCTVMEFLVFREVSGLSIGFPMCAFELLCYDGGLLLRNEMTQSTLSVNGSLDGWNAPSAQPEVCLSSRLLFQTLPFVCNAMAT